MAIYMYKQESIGIDSSIINNPIGTSDISSIGDGTLTGAISAIDNKGGGVIDITKQAYLALSLEEKNRDIFYRITDENYNDTMINLVLGETATTAYAGNKGKALSDKVDELKALNVYSEAGAHNIRYYNDKLSYYNGTAWVDIKTVGTTVSLPGPTNVSSIAGDEEVTIKWTDPDNVVVEGVTFATWESTTLVRKAGAAPSSVDDGVVLTTSTTKNQYATNGYTDTGLTNGVTYFYGIFPKSTDKVYTYTVSTSVTPAIIYPSAATNITTTKNKSNMTITVTYTLPRDAVSAKVVMKAGSEPENSSDGILKTDTTGTVVFDGLSLDTRYYFKVFTYNEKERETSSTSVNDIIKSLEIVTWNAGTTTQIAAMIEAHYAGDIDIADYWNIGDVRTVSIASFSSGTVTHVTQNIQLVIIGIKHDDLTTSINGKTKAAITIQTKQLLGNAGNAESEYYWGSSHYPVADSENWSGSPLRTTYLNTNFYNALSTTTFRSLIKTVTKKNLSTHTGTTTINTSDKIFLPSYPEVFGTTTYSNYISGGAVSNYEGSQYNYFSTSSNRIKYWNNNGANSSTAFHWWLRSPSSNYNSSYGYYWCLVYSDGTANYHSGIGTGGLAPCFTI